MIESEMGLQINVDDHIPDAIFNAIGGRYAPMELRLAVGALALDSKLLRLLLKKGAETLPADSPPPDIEKVRDALLVTFIESI